MSKKQLDELLGLEKFSPLKNLEKEKIKGGNIKATVHPDGSTVIKRVRKEPTVIVKQ